MHKILRFQAHEKLLLKVCIVCILMSLIKNLYNHCSLRELIQTRKIQFNLENQKSAIEARLASGEKVPIREFGQYELELIPGISTITSVRILKYLKRNQADQINLINIKGIGVKKARMLERYLDTRKSSTFQ